MPAILFFSSNDEDAHFIDEVACSMLLLKKSHPYFSISTESTIYRLISMFYTTTLMFESSLLSIAFPSTSLTLNASTSEATTDFYSFYASYLLITLQESPWMLLTWTRECSYPEQMELFCV